MNNSRILWATFAAAALVAALHFAALEWYLYWRFFWYDALSHFVGGVCIALGASWILSRIGIRGNITHYVFAALCIGIVWEIFEFMTHFPQSTWMNYPLDTLKDLVMDCLGGAVGGYIASALRMK